MLGWKKSFTIIVVLSLILVFISSAVINTSASDIATPAIKARQSDEYSPYTAWELGYKGRGVNVAIMDTGIDDGHPSLSGKWVGGADMSKPELFFPRDGTYNADDTNGHGTTCSGIATGTGAPEGTYMGAAPEAKLVDIRIGSFFGFAPGEILQIPPNLYDATLDGIEWARDHRDDKWAGAPSDNEGIDIVSLSWGIDVRESSDGSDPYSQAIDRLVEAGVIVVVAAGNSGPDNDGFDGLGSSSLCITVAATDDQNTITRDDDVIAYYSSRGPRRDNGDGDPYNELKPDIAAPGTDIMQAQYGNSRPGDDGSGNGYGPRGSGTSYATPYIAGIVALMLEANPDLTPELAKEILHFTAERRGEPTLPDLDPFWNRDFGYGNVDSYKACRVTERIEDLNAIDVNLQNFILNISSENSEFIDVEGFAFAKSGSIERVELRIDEGDWFEVSDTNGTWLNWTHKLKAKNIPMGNHTLESRAVSGDKHSLIDEREFTVEEQPEPTSEGAAPFVIAAVILLGVLIAALILIDRHRKRKRSNQ